MSKLAKIIGTGALLLTLGAGLASAIDPKIGVGKHVKELLSIPTSDKYSHEYILYAINDSNAIEQLNKLYFPNDDNQQTLYEVSMLFVESGNPANALRCASGIIDWDKRYEVAEALIKSGNPRNGVKCLEKMPDKYINKGIKLLYDTGNNENVHILINSLYNSKHLLK